MGDDNMSSEDFYRITDKRESSERYWDEFEERKLCTTTIVNHFCYLDNR